MFEKKRNLNKDFRNLTQKDWNSSVYRYFHLILQTFWISIQAVKLNLIFMNNHICIESLPDKIDIEGYLSLNV